MKFDFFALYHRTKEAIYKLSVIIKYSFAWRNMWYRLGLLCVSREAAMRVKYVEMMSSVLFASVRLGSIFSYQYHPWDRISCKISFIAIISIFRVSGIAFEYFIHATCFMYIDWCRILRQA